MTKPHISSDQCTLILHTATHFPRGAQERFIGANFKKGFTRCVARLPVVGPARAKSRERAGGAEKINPFPRVPKTAISLSCNQLSDGIRMAPVRLRRTPHENRRMYPIAPECFKILARHTNRGEKDGNALLPTLQEHTEERDKRRFA